MPRLFFVAPSGEEGTQIQVHTDGQGSVRQVASVIDASDLPPVPPVPPPAPLAATMWVDPDTAVLPADQNGSIELPFATVQQAHDALPANGGTIVVCFSAEEVSAGDLIATKSIGLQGLGQGSELGNITTDSGLTLVNVVASDISAPGGAVVTLKGARCTDINIGFGSLNLTDAIVAGNITAGQIIASNSQATGGTHTIESLVVSANSRWGALSMVSGNIESSNDLWIDTVSAESGLVAKGSRFQGTVTVDSSLQADDCKFESAIGVSVLGQFINCQMPSLTTVGVELQVDSVTYARTIAAGDAFSTPSLVIVDAPLSVTLSIAVPAVAAGDVAYVNTSLVGTALEDLIPPDAPVIVNPQNDLIGAGAGGALVAARISIANTLRVTFLGPLDAGPEDFTVARVR